MRDTWSSVSDCVQYALCCKTLHHPYSVVRTICPYDMSCECCHGEEVRGQSVVFLLEGLVN